MVRTNPPSHAPTIGVDLGATKIALAVVSPTGRILEAHRHATAAHRTPKEVCDEITDCIHDCLGRVGRTARAVGVGVAGQVDRHGAVVTSPNLRWRNVPLRAQLRRDLGRPVFVVNDVHAATFGEWRRGAGRGEKDLVCVFVGTGVGGGVVSQGHLLWGATQTAGEIGHLPLVAHGRRCHCPNAGCLEAYVGGWAIAARAREAVREDPTAGARLVSRAGSLRRIRAEEVAEGYRAGDPFCRRLMDETVDLLADGLSGIVNAFNPQLLLLGGGVIEGSPGMIPAVRALVRRRALLPAVRTLRIARAALGEEAGILGAAALASEGLGEGA